MSIVDFFSMQSDYMNLMNTMFHDVSIVGSYVKRSKQNKRRKLERQNPKRRKRGK